MLKILPKAQEKFFFPSINLSLDGSDPLPFLENFYLTQKGSFVVSEVLQSLHTAKHKRIGSITAPPGSGKSYLALFLGSLLWNEPVWNQFILGLLANQNKTHEPIYEKIREQQSTKERLLPVYLVGESKNLRLTFLQRILESLKTFQDENSFREVLNKIHLESETPKKISKLLEEQDFFEIYKTILDTLAKQNISGLAIFHDEFNRFLTNHPLPSELDFLQDFAEYNLRLKKQKVIYYLLLHKSISQYLNEISAEKRKDYLKIEGRFYSIYFQEQIFESYKLISYFIQQKGFKPKAEHKKQIETHIVQFFKLSPNVKEELGNELKQIALSCYPLHITSLVALTELAQLFGQNERTLFSFLEEILDTWDKTNFISIPFLYSYFDPLIDKLGIEDHLFTKWQYGRSAILETTEPEILTLIQTITILSIINKPNLLPSNLEFLSFALGVKDKNSVYEKIQTLLNKNQVIFRESNHTYQIYYGSSVSVSKKVEESLNLISIQQVQANLEKEFALFPVYANSYNAKYYTSRFFVRKYILEKFLTDYLLDTQETQKYKLDFENEKLSEALEEFLKLILQKEKSKGASGIVFYFLFSENSKLQNFLSSFLESHPLGKEIIGMFLPISKQDVLLIQKLSVLKLLEQDGEFLQQDPKTKEDIKVLAFDYKEKIQHSLQKLFSSSKISTAYFSEYKTSVRSLEELISHILQKRFPYSPKINMELVNREVLSPVIRNARKEILRSMLRLDPVHTTSQNGYGPSVAIFRSLFVVKNLVRTLGANLEFDLSHPTDFLQQKDEGLAKIFQVIQDFLENSNEKNLSELYSKLREEPFGMYKEIIPFYFLAVLIAKEYSYSFYYEERYEPKLDSDLLERIHLHPEKFSIRILKEEPFILQYLQELLEIFHTTSELTFSPQTETKVKENLLYRVTLAILFWYTRLPDHTKKTKRLNFTQRNFLDLIAHSTSPEILLLEQIPKLFGFAFSELKSSLTSLLSRIQETKAQIEKEYPRFLQELSQICVDCFSVYTQNKTSVLTESLQNFLKENQFSIAVLKEHEQDFRSLAIRLESSYSNETSLLESLGTLLNHTHPRYWEDEELLKFKYKLTTELAKLTYASLISGKKEINSLKIQKILDEISSLDELGRNSLLSQLWERYHVKRG